MVSDALHTVERTRHFFDGAAPYWRDVYAQDGLQGLIYRQRMETALRWVDELGLPPASAALDVGCGAGLLCVELASRSLHVTGTDTSPAMIELAQSHADEGRLADRIQLLLADVDRLPVESGNFDVVIALGLLPWVHDEYAAVIEMARVLRPGGHLILSADNRARLNFLVEPRENPLLTPLKLARRAARRAAGRRPDGVPSRLHLPSQVARFLAVAGVRPVRRSTVGFGPFTFLGRPILGERVGLRLHLRLQARADRTTIGGRTGWHYMVEARKPEH